MTDENSSRRPRKAAGPDRPAYFDDADIDRVMAVLLALITEVASIRERLDTHERVAAAGSLPVPALVEGYAADAAAEQAREGWRDAYIRRLFRVITEDIDDLRAGRRTT